MSFICYYDRIIVCTNKIKMAIHERLRSYNVTISYVLCFYIINAKNLIWNIVNMFTSSGKKMLETWLFRDLQILGQHSISYLGQPQFVIQYF